MTEKMLNLISSAVFCVPKQTRHVLSKETAEKIEWPLQAESSANQEERQPHHPHTIIAWTCDSTRWCPILS